MDIRAAEISAILKKQIKDFGKEAEVTEIGQVLSVGDGIARVYGLDNVQAGEMFELPPGYTLNSWKHGSHTVSGFGLFTCKSDATIKFSMTSQGGNLIGTATYLSFGKDQAPVAGVATADVSTLHSESVVSTTESSLSIPAGRAFQPLVKLEQSNYQLTYGKQPVTMIMTIKVKGKPQVTVKKMLALSTSKAPFGDVDPTTSDSNS